MAFKPKGDKSQRTIVVELVARAEIGAFLSFDELTTALGTGSGEPGNTRVRQAVNQARRSLLKKHNRALVSVRGEGYRVALPGEFSGMATKHKTRGERQISHALDMITYAPEKDMSPEELRRHRAVGLVVRSLHNRLSSAETRLTDLEAAVFGPPPPVISGEVEHEDGEQKSVTADTWPL